MDKLPASGSKDNDRPVQGKLNAHGYLPVENGMLSARIVAVDPILTKAPRGYGAWVLVRIRTNQGLDGIGECFSWGYANLSRPKKIRDFVASLGAELTGSNALEIQGFLNRFVPLRTGVEWHAAISGIEIAMWDILGQAAELPICALLGGHSRSPIPLYANHGVFHGTRTLSDRVSRALLARDAGFRMFKWDPFSGGTPGCIVDAVAEVHAFRGALGPDFPLAIDAHGRFNLETALTAVRELETSDILFFEDFVPADRTDWLRPLREATSVPLATGEMYSTRRQLKEALDTGAIRVIQPEIGSNGGILETYKWAAMAEGYEARVASHSWCGPVLTLAAAHVCAAIPNLLYQEHAAAVPEYGWEPELLKPPLRIENGEIVLSDRPGLGSRLDDKILSTIRLDGE